jgi:hypothetical protein
MLKRIEPEGAQLAPPCAAVITEKEKLIAMLMSHGKSRAEALADFDAMENRRPPL